MLRIVKIAFLATLLASSTLFAAEKMLPKFKKIKASLNLSRNNISAYNLF